MAQEGFHHRPAQLPCPRPQGLLEDRAGALPQGCPCPRIRHRPRPRVSVPSLPVNKPHLYPSALTAPSVAPSGLSGGGGAPGELIVSWTVSRGDRGRVCLRFSGGQVLPPSPQNCLTSGLQQCAGRTQTEPHCMVRSRADVPSLPCPRCLPQEHPCRIQTTTGARVLAEVG